MKRSGFTLLELLVALAVVAVVIAAMMPDLAEYLTNMRIRATADQMREGVLRARTEAIKRNVAVDFVPAGTGWTVAVPASGVNPAVTVATRAPLAAETSIVASAAPAKLTFNGSGWVAGGASFSADVTGARGTCMASGGSLRCLRVTVTGAGDVRVCDPAQSDTVGGCF